MDFNVRLLPPYDISDFDVNYPGYSFSNEIIRLYDEEYEEYRKVQNRDVNFYSSYGGNTFMTFDANHKYLFTPNKIYIIRGNDSLKDFYTKMVPHPNYRNYYPIFTFYTD